MKILSQALLATVGLALVLIGCAPAKAPAPVAAPVPFLAAPGLRRHVGGWPGAPDGPV